MQEHASHDAAARRDQKIARHKRCQELDAKVNYLSSGTTLCTHLVLVRMVKRRVESMSLRFAKKRECSGDEYFWGAGSAFDEEMALWQVSLFFCG